MHPGFATSSVSALQRVRPTPLCRQRSSYQVRMKTGGLVLVCDVLDTLVADPFSRGMSSHFGFKTMQDFLAAKQPGTWEKFELGTISESELSTLFFRDRRVADIDAMKRFMSEKYTLLPGVADMLRAFANAGVPVHLCSNYGPWAALIEDAVSLESLGATWTFVSALQGARKPDVRAYHTTAELAGVSPADCVLLDDRQRNCDGAVDAGYKGAVRFRDVDQAREELAAFFGEWLRVAPAAV